MRQTVWVMVGVLTAACSGPATPKVTEPRATPGPAATLPDLAPPAGVSGAASLPPQPMLVRAIDGEVSTLETLGEPAETDRMLHWRVTITAVPVTTSATKQQAVYLIDLPKALNLPIMAGERVTVEADVVGGGPNAVGRIAITDASGALRLAINRAPEPWKVERGTLVATDKDAMYDEQTFTVRITPPGAAAFELAQNWRYLDVADAPFIGMGTAAKRTLHGTTAPPDYVESWLDFSLVALEDAP